MPTYYVKEGEEYKPVTISLIPEGDLMEVKRGAEAKTKGLEDQITALNKEKDDILARALRAETASEEVQGKVSTLQELADKVPSLEEQVRTATESRVQAEESLLGTRRQQIISKYQLQGDAAKQIEGKTAAQLDIFEESATVLGFKPGEGRTFDRGGGDSTNTDGLRGIDKIRLGLEQGALSKT